jgi:hypothetical protein
LHRPNHLIWFALGGMLFVAACSAPGGNPHTATAPHVSPTATPVTEAARTATSNGAESVESPSSTEPPGEAQTARPLVAPSGGIPSTESESSSMETPIVAQVADAAPEKPEMKSGPTEEQLTLLASLDNYGPAPELANEVWLNSDPLRLADLRGKVIMVEFWTFG